MQISIILSTYNQPLWLTKSLLGFVHQRRLPDEIVIADDGSGEETRRVVERFRRLAPFPIRHVWHPDDGFRKTRILNLALAEASSDYLIFSDGDCVPRGDYVAAHARLARADSFLSGGLVRLSLAGSEQIDEPLIRSGRCFRPGWVGRHGGVKPFRLMKLAATGRAARLIDRTTKVLPNWSGSNASCWRRDALAVGGFDERMKYWREDYEFGQRLINLGVTPLQVRYSAVTLHLEHERGYVDKQIMKLNEQILEQTRISGKTRTEHGLAEAA
ncbi:Chondroitin synthase [Posidoniimonas polymericola]|uniref:Chondroitin synthase n=1 Tax=Posidoniimonas polymericola TaxID=2528002 RepID=A0A5C5YAM2_9BACT|nr:glycosyltransferase family 2 protein [Posidoniimonas polymericola]TWT72737.1 Chondroitin synthase [Posidoniimonas polymericola]